MITQTLDTRLKADDLFGELGLEEETSDLRRICNENELVNNLESTFLERGIVYNKLDRGGVVYNGVSSYKDYIEGIPSNYTARDIEFLSVLLSLNHSHIDNFNMRFGLYISALVNECSDLGPFKVNTSFIDSVDSLFYLGYKNKKELLIKGSGGNCVGDSMSKGRITVNGDVGIDCGKNMTGGEIIVNGNAEEYLGDRMYNGRILVNGTVLLPTGKNIGGEIIIEGGYREK